MKSIGGYFSFELNQQTEYHQDAIRLNTGRNAFEFILLANSYKKIYIPYFTCDSLLEPLNKHQIKFDFYSINERFEPLFDFSNVQSDEAFLLINYFGIKDTYIRRVAELCKNLIIDATQSFFFKPIKNIEIFYSPRKFFGVPDGAYLYCKKTLDMTFEKDISFKRCSHLLKRLEFDAKSGFEDFKNNEAQLKNQSIKEMSNLTQSILKTINYDRSLKNRKNNFKFLDKYLRQTNKLNLNLLSNEVPMVYPYWNNDKIMRKKLVENKIFTAIYWPSILDRCAENSLEYLMTKEIIYLPIDQRYTKVHLKSMIDHIL